MHDPSVSPTIAMNDLYMAPCTPEVVDDGLRCSPSAPKQSNPDKFIRNSSSENMRNLLIPSLNMDDKESHASEDRPQLKPRQASFPFPPTFDCEEWSLSDIANFDCVRPRWSLTDLVCVTHDSPPEVALVGDDSFSLSDRSDKSEIFEDQSYVKDNERTSPNEGRYLFSLPAALISSSKGQPTYEFVPIAK